MQSFVPTRRGTLQAEIVQGLPQPDIAEHFAWRGLVVGARSPADTHQFVQGEIRKWTEVAKATGAALD